MHVFELIKKYFSKLTNKSKSSLKLNDDVFFDKKKKLVVYVDTYIEGEHFLNFKNPDLVIKKSLRAAISDLICKGTIPKFYFISCSGNKTHFTHNNLAKINLALKQEQKKYKTPQEGDSQWIETLMNNNNYNITIILLLLSIYHNTVYTSINLIVKHGKIVKQLQFLIIIFRYDLRSG